MTVLFRTIFSGAVDRMLQKMSFYVGFYEYVEVYDGREEVGGVRVYSQ